MRYSYSVVLIPDPEGWFTAEVPALPGCVTRGRTTEEALAMAEDATGLWIEDLAAKDEEIPIERNGSW
ncbi:MAG: type II toxin-antitoxin system HicB family antitoxin [Thermomicrobiales bacterium]